MLLDTCALLWLAHREKHLTASTLEEIDATPVVYISSITAFEITLKSLSRKLQLPVPAKSWLETVLEHHDISVIALDLEICIRAAELPPIHRDPCDRFIIATAMKYQLPVVTRDERFEQYGIRVRK